MLVFLHKREWPITYCFFYFSALKRDCRLSLTEDEIKRRAQPLTDTDLQDKQAGQGPRFSDLNFNKTKK